MDIRKEDGEKHGRYVMDINGIEAEMTYSRMSATAIIVDHTGVPDALAGQGVGKALVAHLIQDATDTGFKIVPLCPFVKAQYARHPEWKPVMMGR
jgi:hypothetical protein